MLFFRMVKIIMKTIITKEHENVFKCNSKEDIVNFVHSVELNNILDISRMNNESFELLFELEELMFKFQKVISKQEHYQEDVVSINDNIDDVFEIIQKIKFKLLSINKQKQEHQETIDECFSETRLLNEVINCNEMIL